MLSKVPGLGWLFKSESQADNERELLIFVTATIVQLERPERSQQAMFSQVY
jgi:type II secretory pathway component GspD/PulD (secretin)